MEITHKEVVKVAEGGMRLQVFKLEDYSNQFPTQSSLARALGKSQSYMSMIMSKSKQYYVLCMLDGPHLFCKGDK